MALVMDDLHCAVHCGDAISVLREMPDESVNCIVTSPPYFGLRDYGHEGQIGLEPTPQEFIMRLVEVFRGCLEDRVAGSVPWQGTTRNARSVWTIATQPYKEAHFATFLEELARRCILAGCPVGGIVLDPFAGSGTTLAVAVAHERRAIGIEINPDYITLINKRMSVITPSLFGGAHG